ncbi:MAG: hypothetical protein AAGB31_12405 [Bdellovibrio sp.]
MKQILIVSALATAAFTVGCSSTPTMPNGQKFEKDVTLSTSNDRPQPEWADETNPWIIKSGKVYSVGVTTLRGDERPEAGMRVSENSARANYAKAIENRMEFIFQGSEENASFESTQFKWIGSEVSSLTSSAMTVEGHWWKRYAQTQEDGSKRIFYKIYSLVTMPESDLKKAVFAAVNKGTTQHKLSDSFKKQVDGQWARFVEGKVDQPQQEQRNPSSKNEDNE